MSITHVKTPTARCCVGLGRSDVTPPLGIYHRFWGAASHDQAAGVHRPLTASVLLLGPLDDPAREEFRVYAMVEHCLFRPDDMDEVLSQTNRLIGIDVERITFTFSHTHSGGHICRARADLPGGELIGPYLDEIPGKIAAAYRTAVDSLQPAVLTHATTCCDMGHHRDFFDAESNQYVCGFNPDHAAGLPVHVIRMTDESDRLMATVVNYPCHPTTLAWLAFDGDRPVGVLTAFVGFSTFKARPLVNIHDVFLKPECRGKGVGKALLAAAEEHARQTGCCRLSLEVLENNPAKGVYESVGFRQSAYAPGAGGALFYIKPLD